MFNYSIILIFCLLAIVGFSYALRYIYKNRKITQNIENKTVRENKIKIYNRQKETEKSKMRVQLLENELSKNQSSVEKNDFLPPLLDQEKSPQTKSKIQVRKAELPDDIVFENVNVIENQTLKEKMKAKQLAMKNKIG
ncbi:hypothetical protein LV89_04498 [Arcicella aurantiaca]|uniref:Uncharacterized protein n=1 Tax=Arcicella aurantiaca TaxID=591202 RepID=A0A316DI76_9BACT|nr:hypothetical protein [Arcicella aurantiaca]PWK17212.1 hypothetical protein LV89_04498 [Arcicella aurantiaca]